VSDFNSVILEGVVQEWLHWDDEHVDVYLEVGGGKMSPNAIPVTFRGKIARSIIDDKSEVSLDWGTRIRVMGKVMFFPDDDKGDLMEIDIKYWTEMRHMTGRWD